MLTFCGNALNPKSETFKFPNASRRRFSGYTLKKKKKVDHSRPNHKTKNSKKQLNCPIIHLQVSVVHPLAMTMSNCINKLLKIPSRLVLLKSSLMNLSSNPSTLNNNNNNKIPSLIS
jgi:hypothetical protein